MGLQEVPPDGEDREAWLASALVQEEEELRMVRGKFILQSITKHSCNYSTAQTFEFGAVCDNSTEENKKFAKYTPSGTLRMIVDNPPAQAFFELGKSYYLDFTEVPSV